MISRCATFGSWMAHTISNLDLDMRVALGDVLYASDDFRHSCSVAEGVAQEKEGCSDNVGAVDSPRDPRIGYLMNDEANGLAA